MGQVLTIDSPTDDEFEKIISYLENNNKDTFHQFL